jgi:hypothetical protein
MDWDRVLRLAGRHRVTPLVHTNTVRLGIPGVPEKVRAGLHALRLSITRSNLLKYGQWLRLCRGFEDRGITAVTLKGFHLALSLYGDPGLRVVGDLDFLVHEEDVARALVALEEMGYRPTPDWAAALHRVGLAHILRHASEMSLRSPENVEVDLHWRTDWSVVAFPHEEILNAPASLPMADQCVLVPSPEVTRGLLLLHGQGAGWAQLRWLVDVAETLEGVPADEIPDLLHELERQGARGALASALRLFEGMWGRRPNPALGGVATREVDHRMPDAFLRTSLEAEADTTPVRSLEDAVRAVRGRTARAPSTLEAIASALRPGVLEWSIVTLPRGLRVGYYLVRVVRVLLATVGTVHRTLPAPAQRTQPHRRSPDEHASTHRL